MSNTVLKPLIVQEQSLSQAQQFSLAILRMSQQELKEYVVEALQSNPLLEENEETNTTANLSVKTQYSIADSYIREKKNFDLDAVLNQNKQEVSFREHVRLQIRTMKTDPVTRRILTYLENNLDRKGWLTVSDEEVAKELKADKETVRNAIQLLQSMDPPGVGARNLKECLTIQLKRNTQYDSCTELIIQSGLELLAQNRIEQLAKKIQCDLGTTRKACDNIRRLNPIPSQGYYTGETIETIIPDAAIMFQENALVIQMNETFIPAIRLSDKYEAVVLSKLSKEDQAFFKHNYEKANNLLWGLQERKRTIQLILEELAKVQSDFFKNGKHLRPFSMTEMANVLKVSVSTISRAVHEKYIVCCNGTIPLRVLFQAGENSFACDGTAVSSWDIRSMIRELIKKEDRTNPLSDEEISKELHGQGIRIARRTVMKYRDSMRIPCSYKRKSRV